MYLTKGVPSHKDWHDNTEKISLSTGITMYYMEAGNKEGELLLLLHGFCDSSRIWRKVMCALGEQFHIYAVDLRGFGQSDKPQQFAYTTLEHAQDLLAFMDVKNIESAYVLGHSMGAMIAQALAFTAPERVKKVILAAPLVRGLDSAETLRAEFDLYENMDLVNMPQKELQEAFLPYPENCKDSEFPDAFFETLRGIPAKALCAAWYGIHLTDHRKFVQFILAPVLILWGNKDDVLNENYQAEVRQFFPNAQYKVLDDVSHEIPNEIPELLAEIATGFFVGQK